MAGTDDMRGITEQVREIEFRIDDLSGRAQEGKGLAPAELQNVVTDLATSLEELHVMQEELTAQSELLTVAQTQKDEERQRFQKLFQLAPESLIVTDKQGTISNVNHAAERLFGKPAKWLAEKPITLLLDSGNRKTIWQLLDDLRRTGENQETTGDFTFDKSTVTSCHIKIAPIRKEDEGNGLQVLWLLRDITREKEAEEVLQSAREDLERQVAERTQELKQANKSLRRQIEEQKR